MEPPPAKKRKTTAEEGTNGDGSDDPIPAPIFLFATSSDCQQRRNKSRDHWSRKECLTLREMLGIGEYAINFLFVGNYIINFEFLLDEIPELLSLPKTCVIYGSKEGSESAWRQACTTLDGNCSVDFICRNPSDPPKSATNPLPQRIPYGTHHTKLFLVGYGSGSLRVVIHTANLRFSDINHKAQAAYIQDFQRKQSPAVPGSEFEDALVSYIETYGYDKKFTWDDPSSKEPGITLAEQLRQYDFSSATGK